MKPLNPETIKYFLYARNSSKSEDRQVASIDSQIDELTKLAQRDNLEVIDILAESQSAKAPGRPVFSNLITRIHNNEAQGAGQRSKTAYFRHKTANCLGKNLSRG